MKSIEEDRRGNERVTRRRAGARTEAIQKSGAEHHRPDRDKPHDRLANSCEEISHERDRYSPLQFVRQGAGKATTFCVARANPSIKPTTLPLALSISVEISAKKTGTSEKEGISGPGLPQ